MLIPIFGLGPLIFCNNIRYSERKHSERSPLLHIRGNHRDFSSIRFSLAQA